MQLAHKWNSSDFSQAMCTAIEQSADRQYLGRSGDKIMFNGFWRNGDSQNVCAWLDKATWHDIKTGQGGGCKEFAKVAFNMSLPEFMQRFSYHKFLKTSRVIGTDQLAEELDIGAIFSHGMKQPSSRPISAKRVNEIWHELCKRDLSRTDLAADWLTCERGFEKPRMWIGSGFANLAKDDIELFDPIHHSLIEHRLSLGPQLVAPLRGVHSDEVKNLFFRAMGDVEKSEKSRLLTGAGGWHEPDETPRAFGLPHLFKDFPNIALCEGMADYFAAELLMGPNEKWLPVGASNADSLNKWALWLSKIKYKGRVTIVHQLDRSDDGELTTKAVGASKAIKAMRTLKDNSIKANFFNWKFYLETASTEPESIRDLADSIQQEARLKRYAPDHLNFCFDIALRLIGDTLSE